MTNQNNNQQQQLINTITALGIDLDQLRNLSLNDSQTPVQYTLEETIKLLSEYQINNFLISDEPIGHQTFGTKRDRFEIHIEHRHICIKNNSNRKQFSIYYFKKPFSSQIHFIKPLNY